MERDTKTIETPVGKHKLVLNTYITGREKRNLVQKFFAKDMNDAEKFNAATDVAVKSVVVSIDGKKEGEISILDAVLDMNSNDTAFVFLAVNAITADKDFEEKKTS